MTAEDEDQWRRRGSELIGEGVEKGGDDRRRRIVESGRM